ncbi:MAG: DUF58 domain-containing protein [Chloroflexota bacterium]
MSRSLLLGVLSLFLLILGLATLHGELLALTIPLALYLLAGFWRAPQIVELDAQRHLSAERVSPNQTVAVTLTIVNRGEALDEVLVEDVLPEGLRVMDGSNRHLARLGRGETATWTYTVTGPRGYYAFPSLRVEARDGLGLIQRNREFAPPGQLLILPQALKLKHVAIRPRRTRVYAGTIPARVGGPGVDFFGVREYQPGDSPRRINWRVSARHGGEEGRDVPWQRLYANEFEQERVADVGIVLDGRDRTNRFGGGRSLFEHSVLAAATLADAFLTQGNRVGLLVYGQYLHWTVPGYGKRQREKIMHALAEARSGGSDIFANLGHLPTRLFPVNSQIVVVSPLAEDDLNVLVQLRARGYQVMAVSPNPAAFELSFLPKRAEVSQAARVVQLERDLLLRKLNRAGVQLLDWDVSVPFDKAVRQSLGRPPQQARALGRSA